MRPFLGVAEQLADDSFKDEFVAYLNAVPCYIINPVIRNNQIEQIQSVIQTNQKEGMITMNKSIDNLMAEGLITEAVARNRKRDIETHATYY